MGINKFGVYFLFLLSCISCKVEKINLSPVQKSNNAKSVSMMERIESVDYASEITNLCATIPRFRSEAVNKEISVLKKHLTSYLSGIDRYDVRSAKNSYAKYENTYKKIQSLKKYLNLDEKEVLNRYLVRIKTNMNILESTYHKEDSMSSIK